MSRRVSATRSTSFVVMPGNSGSETMRCHSARGAGQILGAGAEDIAVVAVLVQRDEVHAGADPGRGQLLDDLVAPDAQLLGAHAQDEEVPGVLDLGPEVGSSNAVEVGERGAVLRDDARAARPACPAGA